MRDFEQWLSTFKTDNIATFEYYNDFKKCHEKLMPYRNEIREIDSMISNCLADEIPLEMFLLTFRNPRVQKLIPLLIAYSGSSIHIVESGNEQVFSFDSTLTDEELMALYNGFHLGRLLKGIETRYGVKSNTYDYLFGVQVGMDTNARKNRGGTLMEDLVEDYIRKAGYTYFTQFKLSEIEKNYQINLDALSNNGNTEKRFDFVFIKDGHVFAVETNFYSAGGSKLNETARSYKQIAQEAENIDGFTFIWITDGAGWKSAKHNLYETFCTTEYMFNINDLENGALFSV